MENIYTVYCHTNKINGKCYIGITRQEVEKRWLNGQGYSKNSHFYNAIKKYGWNNFKHEILYTNLTKEEAEQKEIELIAKLHSNEREFGYNIENGGNSIGRVSVETKQKLREINMGESNPMYGKRGKMCPNYGRKASEKTRRKISENHANLKGENHPMYGKCHAEESKKKISEGNSGKIRSSERKKQMSESFMGGKNPKAKRVVCEGVIYDCIKDCAEHYGVKYDTMKCWLNGTNKMPQAFADKGLRRMEEESGE